MTDTPDEKSFGVAEFLGLGILHKKAKPRSQKNRSTKNGIGFMNSPDEIAVDPVSSGETKEPLHAFNPLTQTATLGNRDVTMVMDSSIFLRVQSVCTSCLRTVAKGMSSFRVAYQRFFCVPQGRFK